MFFWEVCRKINIKLIELIKIKLNLIMIQIQRELWKVIQREGSNSDMATLVSWYPPNDIVRSAVGFQTRWNKHVLTVGITVTCGWTRRDKYQLYLFSNIYKEVKIVYRTKRKIFNKNKGYSTACEAVCLIKIIEELNLLTAKNRWVLSNNSIILI